MLNSDVMYVLQGSRQMRRPDTNKWISLYYWFNWYLNPWTAWSAWSAWYAWSAWSAWYAWSAWPVNWPSNWPSNWPTNWPTQYIPTRYVVTATITGPTFGHGEYYGNSFKLSHAINTGTLTVSGVLQITRQGVD